MISKQYKDLAAWAMDFALKNGCNDLRITIYTGNESSFEYRNNQMDKLQQVSKNKMQFELFVDGRYGVCSTNRMEKEELEKLIREAIVSTRFLDQDRHRILPDPSRYYKNGGNNLNVYDIDFVGLPAENKIELVKSTVGEVYGSDPSVISVSAGFDDDEYFEYQLTSNGFEAESAHTSYTLVAQVSLKGEDGTRPESYWYDKSLFWNSLQKDNIGKTALERAKRKLGQKKIQSGKYTMLLDNTQVSRMLTPLVSAMYGAALQQKKSFLINKLNQQIVSDKLSLTDEPHLEGAIGARWFDSEGVATCRRMIIDKGVLKSYFLDTYYASKLGIAPTIQTPSVLTFAQGKRNHEQMMAAIKRGIWVTGFNGGNSNSSTGDFSLGIEGFLIENGQLVTPVGEMNITGNLLTLWSHVDEVGNDPRTTSSWRTPSVIFDRVDFNGC